MTADPFDTPADPFDVPAHDPVTGELIEDVPTVVAPTPVVADGGGPAPWPTDGPGSPAALLVRLGIDAIPAVASDLPAFAGALRRALSLRVADLHDRLRAQRPEGKPNEVIVAPELRALADAHETLSTIGKAFTTAGGDAKAAAGAVVAEVKGDRDTGGSTSLRVGSSSSDVKVTVTQATEAWADDNAIIDALVAAGVGAQIGKPGTTPEMAAAYAEGARAMAGALFAALASPKWKTSTLDEIGRSWAGLGPEGLALASRLHAAYGRRPKGEPTTNIERLEPSTRTRAI